MTTPDHLRPIEPVEAVHGLCDRIERELGTQGGVLTPVTRMELHAFRDSRTPHDARRLAKALEHVEGRLDLAGAVRGLLFMAGDQWTPEQLASMQEHQP